MIAAHTAASLVFSATFAPRRSAMTAKSKNATERRQENAYTPLFC